MNENFKDTLSKLNKAFKLSQVNGCFQQDLCKEILQELVEEKLNSTPSAEQQTHDAIALLKRWLSCYNNSDVPISPIIVDTNEFVGKIAQQHHA